MALGMQDFDYATLLRRARDGEHERALVLMIAAHLTDTPDMFVLEMEHGFLNPGLSAETRIAQVWDTLLPEVPLRTAVKEGWLPLLALTDAVKRCS